jgi:ribosomal protein S12
MKVDNLYISNIGKGVEATLVAVKDNNDQVYVSIQNNKKLRKNPKVKLISNGYEFSRFLKKVNKELEDHSTPVLYTVASLYCTSQCEIIRVIKTGKDSFDVLFYYNYRRPLFGGCKDVVSLTAVDLEKFIKGEKVSDISLI